MMKTLNVTPRTIAGAGTVFTGLGEALARRVATSLRLRP
ncbi:MAG: hypothetical protein JWR36_1714 [Glaciihabitans sp.]|jgi:hypothetical protein|nr:hypothetical protein [Glaciihabitans sp.]MDQ1570804.1 hypothetical protein [Actinomycetota bacterium]